MTRAAQGLDSAIEAFLASPTDDNLRAAREAWIAARDPYLMTEAHRYYGGPIEQGSPEHEAALNGWPIDESVIDYVRGSSGDVLETGVINMPEVTMDGPTLRSMNEASAETAITTGYHPIEFLLWGQDDPDVDGPGQRPVGDYVDAANADRRATYLRTTSALIIEDLEAVLAEWRAEPGTYRTAMETGDPQDALRNIFTGLRVMSGPELGGERISVALSTRDQEDEHSCFSDNTHREILSDALGIQAVYLGRYERLDGSVVEGPSPSDLVRERDPELDARLRAELDASVTAARALEGPFDEMILGAEGQAQLEAVVAALFTQEQSFVEAAALFDIALGEE